MNKTQTYSVGELTQLIKESLEGNFRSIWVSGEISNFVHHRSGHIYFTLKDDRAEIKAVMFKGNNRYLRFQPDNGMQIILQGRLTVYEQRGYYQLVVTRLEPVGVGTLHLAFEALKERLAGEGLFAPETKQKLPAYPKIVGVITSATGAAFKDISNILLRRAPHVKIILRPTLVQGATAAADIAQAIGDFTAYEAVDVLIIGRGGGSLEDLWAFNEEIVARAIANCPIPVISAVGHETDTTISDLVADLRAPTPSAAAELAAPARAELVDELKYYCEKLAVLINRTLENEQQQLDYLTDRYGFRQPRDLLDRMEERFKRLNLDFIKITQSNWKQRQIELANLDLRLQALNPHSILNRGYALAIQTDVGQLIRHPAELRVGEKFDLQLAKGRIQAEKTADIE